MSYSLFTLSSISNLLTCDRAKEFVSQVSQNPLAFGRNETTNSDKRIFNSDGGSLIRKMANDNKFFLSYCTTLLERMVNTVPREIVLTEPLTPIPVKPSGLQIDINSNGTMVLRGLLRVCETLRLAFRELYKLTFTSHIM